MAGNAKTTRKRNTLEIHDGFAAGVWKEGRDDGNSIFARCAKAGVPEPRIAVGGSTVSIMFPRPGSTAQETASATQETTKEAKSSTRETGMPATAQTGVGTAQTTAQTEGLTTQTAAQRGGAISEVQRNILGYLAQNPTASRRIIAKYLGNITEDGVKYHLARLQAMGMLHRKGPDFGGHWEVGCPEDTAASDG